MGVQAVEEGRGGDHGGDHQAQGRHLPLVEVVGGHVQDVVPYCLTLAVGEARGGLGEGQGRALAVVGEERGLAPGGHLVQPLIGLPRLPRAHDAPRTRRRRNR
ncbi:hypothetical protein [Streptomyces changanensis]|uniref:hypothetical protein n=1 Tax=Streptomyces TaxID=1883 RepID=UPI0012FF6B5D